MSRVKAPRALTAFVLAGAAALASVAVASPASAAVAPCCGAGWRHLYYYVSTTKQSAREQCEVAGLRGQNQRWWNYYYCQPNDYDMDSLWTHN